MDKQTAHAIRMTAIREAGELNERVKQWRNDPRNEQITKQNSMTTDEYMKDINKRGYRTSLDEVDFHKAQRTTLLPSMSQYIMAISEQFDIQVTLLLELLKVRDPKKHEELVTDFDKAMAQDKAHYKKDDKKTETKKEEGKKDMNMVKGLNQREESNLTALIVAGLDGVFQKVRTSNEIMYAVFQKEVEDLRLKQVEAVREEKTEQPKNVVKMKKQGV